MREGWAADEYLVLFEGDEVDLASESYSLQRFLQGYKIVGLRGWDDFIVSDCEGRIFTVPTIPIRATDLAPFRLAEGAQDLAVDEQCAGKIKWYIKPLIFGGHPLDHRNQAWVSHDQHRQLVRYWNDMYLSVAIRNKQ